MRFPSLLVSDDLGWRLRRAGRPAPGTRVQDCSPSGQTRLRRPVQARPTDDEQVGGQGLVEHLRGQARTRSPPTAPVVATVSSSRRRPRSAASLGPTLRSPKERGTACTSRRRAPNVSAAGTAASTTGASASCSCTAATTRRGAAAPARRRNSTGPPARRSTADTASADRAGTAAHGDLRRVAEAGWAGRRRHHEGEGAFGVVEQGAELLSVPTLPHDLKTTHNAEPVIGVDRCTEARSGLGRGLMGWSCVSCAPARGNPTGGRATAAQTDRGEKSRREQSWGGGRHRASRPWVGV